MNERSPGGPPREEAGRPLRLLTHSMSLGPVGGIELCTAQDAVALAQRGHSVQLAFGEDGPLRSSLERGGVGLWGPVSFTVAPRHLLRSAAGFAISARWARSSGADILWLQRFEQIAWGETVAVAARVPLVCHLHHILDPPALALVSRGVAHFVAVSEFMRDTWVDRGIRSERISVVSNAVPPALYPRGGLVERDLARAALGLPADVPVVLYFGRIVSSKGVATLLKAWADVESRAPGTILILAGSPSPADVPQFAPLFARLNAATTLWYPAQDDMIPFLHASDIVAFPVEVPESFGRVIIEAMATGRPVVASRIGATPEILAGPMARFQIEPGDAEELAARLISLLDWRRTEPALEAACVEWVATRYSFERHVDQIEEILLSYRK